MPVTKLTAELAAGQPIGTFFAERFPSLPARPPTPPLQVPRDRDDPTEAWLAGMAFDWRLRLGLCPQQPGAMAQVGAAALGAGWSGTQPSAPEELVAWAAGSDDERQLARIAVLLARFEVLAREGVPPNEPLAAVTGPDALARAVAAVPAETVADLVALTATARRGLAPLFAPGSRWGCNPVFGVGPVGADGDVQVDGTLVEVKTVSRPQLRREWLWQLLGYVLLERLRRRGAGGGSACGAPAAAITHVAVYLARHGQLVRWAVDELAGAMAGTATRLDTQLEAFAAAVAATDRQLRPDG